jgi:hypothetical protein
MKKKSTIKFKGTRYTAKVLNKYFSKKYPNYSSALPKAREVYAQLKSEGKKPTTRNIFFIVRKHRVAKPTKQAPELFFKLQQPEQYYILTSYPSYIKTTTNEITFISDLFNVGVTQVQGGETINYRDTFQDFVNFGNKYSAERGLLDSSDIDIYIVCTPPEEGMGDLKGKWVSKIITVDSGGHPSDFGFEPGKPIEFDEKLAQKQKASKQQKVSEQIKEQVEVAKIKEEAEKIRQENINSAMKLFSSGQISKLEFKDMIAIINKQA